MKNISHRSYALVAFFTLVATVLRTLRAPNDFAEAQWLTDWRYGFIKRGLVGQLLSPIVDRTEPAHLDLLIWIAASSVALLFFAALYASALLLLRRSGWNPQMKLLALLFLSSPTLVMSAHLVGYFEQLLIVLAMISILALGRWPAWIVAGIQCAAVLVHENYLVIGLPAVALALWLGWARQESSLGTAAIVLLPPVALMLLITVHQAAIQDTDALRSQWIARLSSFSFIRDDRARLGPDMLLKGFSEYLSTEAPQFFSRLTYRRMILAFAPFCMLSFAWLWRSSPPRTRKDVVGLALTAGVIGAPLALHLIAWDTVRIWSFTGFTAWLSLLAQVSPAWRERAADRWPAFLVFAAAAAVLNAFGTIPLMDEGVERFSAAQKALLYSPAWLWLCWQFCEPLVRATARDPSGPRSA